MNAAPLVNPFGAIDWTAVVPLFIVGGVAVLVLLADLLTRKPNGSISTGIGIIGLAAAGIYAARAVPFGTTHNAFFGGFMLGGFATVMQEVIVIAAIVSLAIVRTNRNPQRMGGTVALLLWATTGAMLMAGAANLMTIFLGLELLSLALYCLCALGDRASSRESGLKYLILSSTASGFLLFGMALLFGASGSITLGALASPALAHDPLYWLGAGLFLIGIAFKLSLMPFHIWSPDVYEGAPLPVTAYMSVVTKAGTLAVLARFIFAAYAGGSADKLLLPIYIIAAISMIGGNAAMLAQTDLKRLLAYSGIAQAAYIVAALAGGTALGVRYAIYYLAAYTFMNMGAFAIAAVASADGEEGTHLTSYRGLAYRRPWLAAAMTFFLLALAGFPPTAGFLGKILILSTNVTAGYAWLGAFLIAGTAISLYAYFKVVRAMYERPAPSHPAPPATAPAMPLAYVSITVCALLTLIMTFYPLTPSAVLPLIK
ncbi:MAG TPA: NADH-quinone oxidoreductase subunit N [Candidatus Baltobacteraceae bacterium]|nr:NADH-quinone oxidoreductase subunit N [Candidatus Baltobacteraceae bacterium]